MKIKWETYALDACQTILDASMFWTGEDEEKNPGLKRARTIAGKAMELYRDEMKKDVPDLLYACKQAMVVINQHYPEGATCCQKRIDTVKNAIQKAEKGGK